MSFFRRKTAEAKAGIDVSPPPKLNPKGQVLPNWSRDLIVSQSHKAHTPPSLYGLASNLVERTGKSANHIVLQRLFVMVSAQIDEYTSALPLLADYNFSAIREELFNREDFHETILFDHLTYFGPQGWEVNNALIGKVPLFVETLEEVVRDGDLETW